MKNGIIFDISHYMLEDGPGIRTNVFFKGCPLRCKWCSNVYGLEKNEQISFDKSRCTGCGKCLDVCPKKAVGWDEDRRQAVTDFDLCVGSNSNSVGVAACDEAGAYNGKANECVNDVCDAIVNPDRGDISCDFACVNVCSSKARKKIGKVVTTNEVFREVEKDFSFYRRGGGGVTLSGGEILMQAEFAIDILKTCQNAGINTAVETSGFGNWNDLSAIIDYCDTVFMDCKCMDSAKHKLLTGVENSLIISNIKKAAEKCEHMGIPLIVRLPLIPTQNDDVENIKNTADFVRGLEGNVLLNVLPYHNYGAAKYECVGRKYYLDHIKIQTKAELEKVKIILEETGVRFSIGGYDT